MTAEAFTYLERGHDERDASCAWLKVAKETDPVRADPRFRALLR